MTSQEDLDDVAFRALLAPLALEVLPGHSPPSANRPADAAPGIAPEQNLPPPDLNEADRAALAISPEIGSPEIGSPEVGAPEIGSPEHGLPNNDPSKHDPSNGARPVDTASGDRASLLQEQSRSLWQPAQPAHLGSSGSPPNFGVQPSTFVSARLPQPPPQRVIPGGQLPASAAPPYAPTTPQRTRSPNGLPHWVTGPAHPPPFSVRTAAGRLAADPGRPGSLRHSGPRATARGFFVIARRGGGASGSGTNRGKTGTRLHTFGGPSGTVAAGNAAGGKMATHGFAARSNGSEAGRRPWRAHRGIRWFVANGSGGDIVSVGGNGGRCSPPECRSSTDRARRSRQSSCGGASRRCTIGRAKAGPASRPCALEARPAVGRGFGGDSGLPVLVV